MISPNLPDHARVWIYQADRVLTDAECAHIVDESRQFLATWMAHQQDLLAWAEMRHSLFLFIEADEEQAKASGCSIDKSVHFIKDLGKKLNVDFMNRLLFAYRNGDSVRLVNRQEFESLVAQGVIHDETIVFDNLVRTRGDLSRWEIPFRQSWHKQLV